MKRTKISMLALAAVALCACTSEDMLVTETASPAITGDGYISLAINLPTTASTRAANDVYDDGLPSEYAVNDATLLLFEGEAEASAVCYGVYDLTTAFDMEPNNDNITSRSQVTAQIDTPASGEDNLYALVILNGTGMANYVGTYVGKTLSDLQTSSVECGIGAMTTNGFYMCNAPLINATGSGAAGGTVTTLATIDGSKIYATEEKAAENVAAEVYVERGMAKVTVDASGANTSVDLASGTIDVTIDGFALDLTNNVTYPVRNTTTASAEANGTSWWGLASGSSAASQTDLYRFAGTTIVDNNGLYRTYWAEDPNYNTTPYSDGDEGARNYGNTMNYLAGLTFGSLGESNPQYCLENTFSVARQNQDETTRAIVQATWGNADFYILDHNHSVLYTYAQMLDIVMTDFASNTDVRAAIDAYYLDEETNIFEFYAASMNETAATEDATFSIGYVAGIDLEEFAELFRGGTIPAVLDPTTTAFQAVVDAINAARTIGYYQNGVSYYPVMIKHFGDDLTPWDEATVLTGDEGTYTPDTDNYNTSYPGGIWNTTADGNWLGRYGVLRNNWYDLEITSIAEPGYATPPSATGKPDDPTELWLSVDINILSWAKRTQDVTL